MTVVNDDPVAAFIEASVWHGALDEADAIRAAHPDLASRSIYAAAILGDDREVRRFLDRDPALATATGGPRGWDALTYLCFSKYLRLDPSRSDGFVRAATTLLDAGASANAGFWNESHLPTPEWEPALYGAAGVAHHAPLTRLLLERGANPNDEEVAYHAPESYDNAVLRLLLDTGTVTDDNLALMLVRKHDWHDEAGVRLLLEHRAIDLNRQRGRGWNPLHHAIARDNDRVIVEALLDHGADPAVLQHGRSAVSLAARRGRGDLLELFEHRRGPLALHGVDRLIAACARHDAAAIRAIAVDESERVREMLAESGRLLAEFSGNGNAEGVRHLLDLGADVAAVFASGDGYWNVAKDSTALHVAAWRAQHATVKLLIERGAPIDAQDGEGRTPLMLAVRACVDSYWTHRRSPASVGALLDAGASKAGLDYPSGYEDVDALLLQP
jgi:hypothetical protein